MQKQADVAENKRKRELAQSLECAAKCTKAEVIKSLKREREAEAQDEAALDGAECDFKHEDGKLCAAVLSRVVNSGPNKCKRQVVFTIDQTGSTCFHVNEAVQDGTLMLKQQPSQHPTTSDSQLQEVTGKEPPQQSRVSTREERVAKRSNQ